MIITIADDDSIKFYKNVNGLCLVGEVGNTEKVDKLSVDPAGELLVMWYKESIVISYLY